MRSILIMVIVGLLFGCGQTTNKRTKDADVTNDPVDYYERFDLANTVDTTGRTYKPKIDSTYIFPSDSSDIVAVTDYSDYRIRTTIFPVRNKYRVIFSSSFGVTKINFRDYKLQVDITDDEGLHLKRVITKYDFPDSIISDPKYYFIRGVRFKGLENDEFRFDIKVSLMENEEPSVMIKCFIHLVDGIRFEDYPKTFYDSLYAEPEF